MRMLATKMKSSTFQSTPVSVIFKKNLKKIIYNNMHAELNLPSLWENTAPFWLPVGRATVCDK